jgi:ABC-type polysaccharide/polyol phosphate export permease
MLNKIIKPIAHKLPENNRFERIWKLAQNDFKKRYRGSVLGLFWALLNPLFMMTLFYFVFTYFLQRSTPNFHIHLFSGIILWLFFVQSTMQSINVFLSKRYLIENIQFNKLDLFISKTISSFIGFAFNIGALVIMTILAGYKFSYHLLLVPILFFILYLITLSISIILAVLKIFVKDIHHLWDVITLTGYWTCPIFYDESILLEKFRVILYLNPIAYLLIAFRDVFLRNQWPEVELIIYATIFSVILLFVSVYSLKKYEHLIIEKL